jgi:hypothetical protein
MKNMNKPRKYIVGIILTTLVIIGAMLGTFGGMADSSIIEQRLSILYGYSISILSLIAIVCITSKEMNFKIKQRSEKLFYICSLMLFVIFLLLMSTL